MARNGSGTYSKVNTFVAGNTITAAGHNENWDDLVTEMTNSVAADGQTSLTGGLKGANGTKTAPSYSFATDTDTGMYRIGANNLGLSCGDTKIMDMTTTGTAFVGTLSASGAVTASSTLDVTGNVAVNTNKFNVTAASGNTTVAGTLGVTGATTLSSTAAITGNLAVNTDKFTVAAASGNTVVAGTLAVTGVITPTGGFTAGSIANAALAAPGGLVRISSQTASTSAALDFTSGITSTYNTYIFVIDNLVPATDNVDLLVQVSNDAGSNWRATNYLSQCMAVANNAVNARTQTTTSIPINGAGLTNTTAFGGLSGAVYLFNPSGSTHNKMITFSSSAVRQNTGLIEQASGSGQYTGAQTAVTGVRFAASSGNLATGKVTMYGLTDS